MGKPVGERILRFVTGVPRSMNKELYWPLTVFHV